MYRFELKLHISQLLIVSILTVVVLGVITYATGFIDLSRDDTTIIEENLETFDVDLELTTQIAAANNGESIQTDAAYLEDDPDLLMLKLKSPKYVSATDFNSFLKKMANKTGSGKSASTIQTQNISSTSTSTQTNKAASTINYNALASNEDPDSQSLSHKELKQVVAKNYSVFQKCYEKSLVKDELLSGNASVILNIGKKANVSFKGVGQEKVKEELKRCISKKAIQLPFPKKLRGNKIKFSLYFNS